MSRPRIHPLALDCHGNRPPTPHDNGNGVHARRRSGWESLRPLSSLPFPRPFKSVENGCLPLRCNEERSKSPLVRTLNAQHATSTSESRMARLSDMMIALRSWISRATLHRCAKRRGGKFADFAQYIHRGLGYRIATDWCRLRLR
jgi:hypothetical protein